MTSINIEIYLEIMLATNFKRSTHNIPDLVFNLNVPQRFSAPFYVKRFIEARTDAEGSLSCQEIRDRDSKSLLLNNVVFILSILGPFTSMFHCRGLAWRHFLSCVACSWRA
ncbi:hypothetical protein K469DRAFT_188279 [Zopfia rhizophila CBS 207.26]|uniref:Uncharacterized protein n=1 Tax=Zopfia rhizophila CBS 207.26 TaxID=1314779 RepID=A0A6A6ESK8_9PEZI|nr:hypothetical protein K469DRAFT_188279 [Zopfia rhizophila CBS 207.26]